MIVMLRSIRGVGLQYIDSNYGIDSWRFEEWHCRQLWIGFRVGTQGSALSAGVSDY
jgi:hypothetical protein